MRSAPLAIVTGLAAALLIAASCGPPRPPSNEPEPEPAADAARVAVPVTADASATPPPCDPHRWDAANPSCATECNLADPDLGREICCKVMKPCVKRPRGRRWDNCYGTQLRFDGNTIIANRGSDHAFIQHLDAHLSTDGPEPEPPSLSESERNYRWNRLSSHNDFEPRLTLVELRATESVWRLTYPKDHDLAWLATHAKAVVIEPPSVCRMLGTGRP